LAPQLAEFELRFQSRDYDTALGVLLEIDFDYLMLWGHSRIALEYHQRLQGKIEDDSLKKDSLNILGICCDNLGDYQKAIEHHQQYLDIVREIGYRNGQGHSLKDLACTLLLLGDTDLDQAHLNTAAEIWEDTGSPDVVEAYVVLSISLLKSGQYQKGKTTLEKARRQARIFLEKANRLETIDLNALALCGLTVCEHDKTYADKAREAFAKARAITKAKGQVNRVLKFFDLIAESDKKGLLTGLREVAAGIEK
jgi:tetratricopeptide (TPR) repeat protein